MEEVIARTVRFLALDPGSRTLGLAVLEYDFETGKLHVLFTRCLDVDEGLKSLRYMEDLIGTRLTRLKIIADFLKNQIEEWEPSTIIMETPYMGSHAQAFKILVEVMRTIEQCVLAYSNGIPLEKIDPSTVKKTIGVKGNCGDKDLMLIAVKAIDYLVVEDGIDLDTITEHEVDGIAVGNFFCVSVLKSMG